MHNSDDSQQYFLVNLEVAKRPDPNSSQHTMIKGGGAGGESSALLVPGWFTAKMESAPPE